MNHQAIRDKVTFTIITMAGGGVSIGDPKIPTGETPAMGRAIMGDQGGSWHPRHGIPQLPSVCANIVVYVPQIVMNVVPKMKCV